MSALQPGDKHLEGDGLGITPDELKHSPLAINAKRDLKIPPRRGPKSHTPPSCPRFSEFNAIHSRDGGNDAA
jgi:hypothetical protein